jgi:hypothetical protein
MKTFSEDALCQYLNDGITEVNRAYPLHVTDTFTVVQDQVAYETRFSSIYRVEMWDGSTFLGAIPFNDGNETYAGWELLDRTLYVPPSLVSEDMTDAYASLTIKATGYARRQLQPITVGGKAVQLELDAEAAMGVRWFAAYRAYQSLMSDRSAFKQWQGQSNNSDVSMPMLMNLVQTASQMWERHRRNFVTYRRSPVGDPVVI